MMRSQAIEVPGPYRRPKDGGGAVAPFTRDWCAARSFSVGGGDFGETTGFLAPPTEFGNGIRLFEHDSFAVDSPTTVEAELLAEVIAGNTSVDSLCPSLHLSAGQFLTHPGDAFSKCMSLLGIGVKLVVDDMLSERLPNIVTVDYRRGGNMVDDDLRGCLSYLVMLSTEQANATTEAVPNAVNRGWLAGGVDTIRRSGSSFIFAVSQIPEGRARSLLVAISLGMPFGRVPAFGGGNIIDLFLSTTGLPNTGTPPNSIHPFMNLEQGYLRSGASIKKHEVGDLFFQILELTSLMSSSRFLDGQALKGIPTTGIAAWSGFVNNHKSAKKDFVETSLEGWAHALSLAVDIRDSMRPSLAVLLSALRASAHLSECTSLIPFELAARISRWLEFGEPFVEGSVGDLVNGYGVGGPPITLDAICNIVSAWIANDLYATVVLIETKTVDDECIPQSLRTSRTSSVRRLPTNSVCVFIGHPYLVRVEEDFAKDLAGSLMVFSGAAGAVQISTVKGVTAGEIQKSRRSESQPLVTIFTILFMIMMCVVYARTAYEGLITALSVAMTPVVKDRVSLCTDLVENAAGVLKVIVSWTAIPLLLLGELIDVNVGSRRWGLVALIWATAVMMLGVVLRRCREHSDGGIPRHVPRAARKIMKAYAASGKGYCRGVDNDRVYGRYARLNTVRGPIYQVCPGASGKGFVSG